MTGMPYVGWKLLNGGSCPDDEVSASYGSITSATV
ncbi:hypothetical protein KGM_207646 [Danaus plexippus plexippus]|uniref:Uncharacterized protein n=1 Tax=Danaus plexippus plexippus TaxID=278856 RepID=A0A212EQ72_DANPL|nr:hypothetical protein KGM_207646 [Danaus plexippus plexippus]